MFTSRRHGFTSELFKLKVSNVPWHINSITVIKSRLRNLNLDPVKVNICRSCWFVTFRNEEARQEAMKIITGHVWGKMTLHAIPAEPKLDPILKRKIQLQAASADELEAKRCEDTRDLSERLSDAITPLFNMPYEEQLSLKTNYMRKFLEKTANSVNRFKPEAWFKANVLSNGGLLCPLDSIKPSPVLTEYRNKCGFGIGFGPNNKTVVGFRLGRYMDGNLTVAPPTTVIVSKKMKRIVQVVEEFVSDSTLKTFDLSRNDGHWMNLLVHHFTTGETMAIVHFHKQQLSQDIIEKEQQSLLDKFKSVDPDIRPTSIYCTMEGKPPPTLQHLMGTEYIHEELLGITFRVSPKSFFEVNTKATEVLYSTVGELVRQNVHGNLPVIYDLCCDTGSIGIALSKIVPVRKVIGIKTDKQAIANARHNATANGLGNTEFICGSVESTLPLLKGRWSESLKIAVVDPSRQGLSARVIHSIKKCSDIETLVYVSCKPEGPSRQNFIDLCQATNIGLPFKPIKAIPVDLFPHTSHCILVVLFERVKIV